MSIDSSAGSNEEFQRLQQRLLPIWNATHANDSFSHTSLIVPSLSVDQDELSKVQGASFYEERLLFALIRLRNPNARLIYVTSQPVHPDVVDYYLQLLVGVPASHARRRLQMLCLFDASPRPLTEKVLERPRVLQRLRDWIAEHEPAYLTCYNTTMLERRLALELDIPLNGVDPVLLPLGTKTGSRKTFAAAGVPYPAGFEDLHSEDEIVNALCALAQQRPEIRRAVVKINEGFSGEGNGVFTYPAERSDSQAVRQALQQLEWSSARENISSFLRKYNQMGGIVEEMIEAEEVRSPSVQMRIRPDGTAVLVSSHEQVLGGKTGQVYLGCRFPARQEYRSLIQQQALRIGQVLSDKGVIGRFGIDFLLTRSQGGDWQSHALEINLRMGGTTPPFHALEFLTSGRLNPETGMFHAPTGQEKFYSATDNLKSPAYRGLLPEDLFDIVIRHNIHYQPDSGTGVLFYMIGALSQYGKLGMTCIGNSPAQASDLFQRTVALLDKETESGDAEHGELGPLFDNTVTME
ncbi:MAG TPA: peptide ligase PGM1-related protein [Xanthomonadales bacterium]|nr:peptide ligase PGM1-related protein [Xanthomonadales bacterium]